MGWVDTLLWPFKRMPPEVTAFLVVVAGLFVLSWMNRDLNKGFSGDDAAAIQRGPGAANNVYSEGGYSEGGYAQPQSAVTDRSAEMVQQAQAFIAQMNAEGSAVRALQYADTAAALLTAAGSQRPDWAPRLQPMLHDLQLRRSQLSAHVENSVGYA